MTHITESHFKKRFISLVSGGRDFPRKRENLHILLISALFGLKKNYKYSQKELTEKLCPWADTFGDNFNIDVVVLRRCLVDEGYFTRDPAGNVYELSVKDLPFSFDESIRSIDPELLMLEAREKKA